MALVNLPQNDRKRVKVYELRNNDWFDRGTGFCSGQVVEVRTQHHSLRRRQHSCLCLVNDPWTVELIASVTG